MSDNGRIEITDPFFSFDAAKAAHYKPEDRAADFAAFLADITACIADKSNAEHTAIAWFERGAIRYRGQLVICVEFPRHYDAKPTRFEEARYLATERCYLTSAAAAAAICDPNGPHIEMYRRRTKMEEARKLERETSRAIENERKRAAYALEQRRSRIQALNADRTARAFCELGDRLKGDAKLTASMRSDPAAFLFAIADALHNAPSALPVNLGDRKAVERFVVTEATAHVFRFAPIVEINEEDLDGVEMVETWDGKTAPAIVRTAPNLAPVKS